MGGLQGIFAQGLIIRENMKKYKNFRLRTRANVGPYENQEFLYCDSLQNKVFPIIADFFRHKLRVIWTMKNEGKFEYRKSSIPNF